MYVSVYNVSFYNSAASTWTLATKRRCMSSIPLSKMSDTRRPNKYAVVFNQSKLKQNKFNTKRQNKFEATHGCSNTSSNQHKFEARQVGAEHIWSKTTESVLQLVEAEQLNLQLMHMSRYLWLCMYRYILFPLCTGVPPDIVTQSVSSVFLLFGAETTESAFHGIEVTALNQYSWIEG